MNLNNPVHRNHRDRTQLFGIVLLLFITVSVWFFPSADANTNIPFLGAEEKEIAYLTIDRIEKNIPQLKDACESFKKEIEADQVELSEAFFGMDPIHQESELIRFMLGKMTPLVPPSDEVAFSEE